MTKALTLSIVIPVYNEEHHLKACLDSIAAQTVMPDEVIVVDNNCTDKTVEVAQQFDFVTIVEEPVQGRGPARSRGFNTATGDIIGRIDADSILMPNWADRVLGDFADPTVAAVTGLGKTNTLPRIKSFRSTLWSRVYYWYVHAYFGAMTTWGANMAVRRSEWEKVRLLINNDDGVVHEDQDISLLIAGFGGNIIQDDTLMITTNGQTYHYWPKFLGYNRRARSTRRWHQQHGTLNHPQSKRLSFLHTLPGRILSVLLTIPFALVSLLLWPIDWSMVRIFKNKAWLD